jgi:MFS family permease
VNEAAHSTGQIYQSVGFEKDALLINSINNVIGLLGQVVCVMFLDRIGRRPPLIWGNIIASVCFAICT